MKNESVRRTVRRSKRGIGTAIGVVILIIGLAMAFVFFSAIGAPSAPTVSLAQTLTPSQAQTVSLTIVSNVYAVLPPNSVYFLGTNAIFTVIVGSTTIVANASLGLNTGTNAGNGYPVIGTAQVSIPQLCSTGTCPTYTENLTVYATVFVHSLWGTYSSTTKTVLGYGATPVVAHATPFSVFLFQATAPILIAAAVFSLLGGLFYRPWLYIVTVVSVGGIVVVAVLAFVIGG
jgi:hypothetical protein